MKYLSFEKNRVRRVRQALTEGSSCPRFPYRLFERLPSHLFREKYLRKNRILGSLRFSSPTQSTLSGGCLVEIIVSNTWKKVVGG